MRSDGALAAAATTSIDTEALVLPEALLALIV